MERNIYKIGKELFITSEEEIQDCYVLTDLTKIVKVDKSNEELYHRFNCKKIILTTDQNLIKDGVQAIDDEFLEWFVKNPSCEWVDVDTRPKVSSPFEKGFVIDNPNYNKTIIPKEEFNETLWKEIKASGIDKPFILEEEPKQECKGSFKDCFKPLDECVCDNMNKETLEEVAERESEVQGWGKYDSTSEQYAIKQAFLNGAKHQSEKMYSEEEVHKIVGSYSAHIPSFSPTFTYKEWFEQFKKK